MEQIFKDKLLKLKNPDKITNFSQEILPNADWVELNVDGISQDEVVEEIKGERKIVLENLQKFAEEKLENKEEVKINQVTIAKKENSDIEIDEFLYEEAEKLTSEEFLDMASQIEASAILERLEKRVEYPEKLKVIFVTDKFLNIENPKSEFHLFFEEETAELFKRMVAAMKLSDDEFLISAINDHDDNEYDFFLEELAFFTPEIVMTLGASATTKVLGVKQRLSSIHGNFYLKGIKYLDNTCAQLSVCPIFHPEFLRINPNMKKTAWEDMQKVMKKIQKL